MAREFKRGVCEVTVMERPATVMQTVSGPVSYKAWCEAEVNRLNKHGNGRAFIKRGHRGRMCVAVR